jgi:hypothetical protein
MIDVLERKHAILLTEFDRYVVEHPEFAVKIPRLRVRKSITPGVDRYPRGKGNETKVWFL